MSFICASLPAMAQGSIHSFTPVKKPNQRWSPLPSEAPVYIPGSLPVGIKRVELKSFKAKKMILGGFLFWGKAPLPKTEEKKRPSKL